MTQISLDKGEFVNLNKQELLSKYEENLSQIINKTNVKASLIILDSGSNSLKMKISSIIDEKEQELVLDIIKQSLTKTNVVSISVCFYGAVPCPEFKAVITNHDKSNKVVSGRIDSPNTRMNSSSLLCQYTINMKNGDVLRSKTVVNDKSNERDQGHVSYLLSLYLIFTPEYDRAFYTNSLKKELILFHDEKNYQRALNSFSSRYLEYKENLVLSILIKCYMTDCYKELNEKELYLASLKEVIILLEKENEQDNSVLGVVLDILKKK